MTDRLLTADQVAELLSVPRSWVYQQARSGAIPHVRLGRYVRYRHEAVIAWVATLETPGTTSTTHRTQRPKVGGAA